MLSVENLTLHYGASQILHGVSLTARPGAVTAVMGTNGVGKTSLLKAIAGRHPYSGGRISLDGVALDHLSAAQAARAGIGYVPQGREVFPPNIIKQIGEVIGLLRDEGEIAIVLVEQYFDFAYGLADDLVVLNRGEVRLSEPAATVERARLLREVSI